MHDPVNPYAGNAARSRRRGGLLPLLLGSLLLLFFLVPFGPAAPAKVLNADLVDEARPLVDNCFWLLDSEGSRDINDVASGSFRDRFRPLPEGLPITGGGPFWLRLLVIGNSDNAVAQHDGKRLVMNLGELPPGRTRIFFSDYPGPVTAKGVWHSEYVEQGEDILLPRPGSLPLSIYIRMDEAPNLWFDPIVRPQASSLPFGALPGLLLPAIFIAAAVICLLRAFSTGAVWPFWAAFFLLCLTIQSLFRLPSITAPFNYQDLPVLLAPGLALLTLPHIGRCLFARQGEALPGAGALSLCSLLGAAVALLPLVPGLAWLTRLFSLWPLTLLLLLPFCLNMLKNRRPGSQAYTTTVLLGVAGAALALYGIHNPGLHPQIAKAGLWGLALGGLALLFVIPPKRQEARRGVAPAQRSEADGRIVADKEAVPGGTHAIALPPADPEAALTAEDEALETVLSLKQDWAVSPPHTQAGVDHEQWPSSVHPETGEDPGLAEDTLSGVETISLRDDAAPAASALPESYQTIQPIGQDQAEATPVVFSLQTLVREAQHAASIEAKKKGLVFSWFIAPSLPAYYEGDAPLLRSTLALLLRNAVDATRGGMVQLSVRKPAGSSRPGDLLFSIADSGSAERADAGYAQAAEIAAGSGGSFNVEHSPSSGSLLTFTACYALPSESGIEAYYAGEYENKASLAGFHSSDSEDDDSLIPVVQTSVESGAAPRMAPGAEPTVEDIRPAEALKVLEAQPGVWPGATGAADATLETVSPHAGPGAIVGQELSVISAGPPETVYISGETVSQDEYSLATGFAPDQPSGIYTGDAQSPGVEDPYASATIRTDADAGQVVWTEPVALTDSPAGTVVAAYTGPEAVSAGAQAGSDTGAYSIELQSPDSPGASFVPAAEQYPPEAEAPSDTVSLQSFTLDDAWSSFTDVPLMQVSPAAIAWETDPFGEIAPQAPMVSAPAPPTREETPAMAAGKEQEQPVTQGQDGQKAPAAQEYGEKESPAATEKKQRPVIVMAKPVFSKARKKTQAENAEAHTAPEGTEPDAEAAEKKPAEKHPPKIRAIISPTKPAPKPKAEAESKPAEAPIVAETPPASPAIVEAPQAVPAVEDTPQPAPVIAQVPPSAPIAAQVPQPAPAVVETVQDVPTAAEALQAATVVVEASQILPEVEDTPQLAPVIAQEPHPAPVIVVKAPQASPAVMETPQPAPTVREESPAPPEVAETAQPAPAPTETPQDVPAVTIQALPTVVETPHTLPVIVEESQPAPAVVEAPEAPPTVATAAPAEQAVPTVEPAESEAAIPPATPEPVSLEPSGPALVSPPEAEEHKQPAQTNLPESGTGGPAAEICPIALESGFVHAKAAPPAQADEDAAPKPRSETKPVSVQAGEAAESLPVQLVLPVPVEKTGPESPVETELTAAPVADDASPAPDLSESEASVLPASEDQSIRITLPEELAAISGEDEQEQDEHEQPGSTSANAPVDDASKGPTVGSRVKSALSGILASPLKALKKAKTRAAEEEEDDDSFPLPLGEDSTDAFPGLTALGKETRASLPPTIRNFEVEDHALPYPVVRDEDIVELGRPLPEPLPEKAFPAGDAVTEEPGFVPPPPPPPLSGLSAPKERQSRGILTPVEEYLQGAAMPPPPPPPAPTPMREPEPAPTPAPARELEPAPLPAESRPPAPFTPRVLIGETITATVQRMVTHYLAEIPHETVTVKSNSQIRQRFADMDISLFVLDADTAPREITLIIKDIRKMEAEQDRTPSGILCLTGGESNAERLLSAGASFCLPKPFAQAAFLEAVRSITPELIPSPPPPPAVEPLPQEPRFETVQPESSARMPESWEAQDIPRYRDEDWRETEAAFHPDAAGYEVAHSPLGDGLRSAQPSPQRTGTARLEFRDASSWENTAGRLTAPAPPAPEAGKKPRLRVTSDGVVTAGGGHHHTVSTESPSPSLVSPASQNVALPGLHGESLDMAMLPLVPGLLHFFDNAYNDCLRARKDKNQKRVRDATARLAGRAETFGLERLGKLARCVERAAKADDQEAMQALLDDLDPLMNTYVASLRKAYDAFLEMRR